MSITKNFFYARVLCDTNLYKVEISEEEQFHYGREVIIKTEFGEDFAVITSWKSSDHTSKVKCSKAFFIRYANSEDKLKKQELDTKAQLIKARINTCKDKLELKMQITHILLPLSGNSIGIFYVAQGRVDFRQLLTDLKKLFKEKVIMRQISHKQREESFSFDPRTPIKHHGNYL